MKRVKLYIAFIMISMAVFGQEDSLGLKPYEIDPIEKINTGSNEFAPFVYKNKLIFCSDVKREGLITYTDYEGNTLSDVYVVDRFGGRQYQDPVLFAEGLRTNHNEGAISYDWEKDRLYYTQNRLAKNEKGNSKENNPLKIFYALNRNDEFTSSYPALGLTDDYSYKDPSISMDGSKLFFSSNMPGGQGGYDIWMSEQKNGRWDKPVNLGPKVNTKRDEIYPFAHVSGRLYFSSNGHEGVGRHDIFYTYFFEDEWAEPIPEDKLNSRANDCGIFIADDLKSGYFASDKNRQNGWDIFEFVIHYPEFEECKEMEKSTFCYRFYDENSSGLDTTAFLYEWDFGDGHKARKEVVDHCFEEPGNYLIQLNLYDAITNELFLNQSSFMLEVKEVEQVYIGSMDTVRVGEELVLEGSENMEGFEDDEYYWFMGDGSSVTKAYTRSYNYEKEGVYEVKLGVTSTLDERTQINKACSSKRIVVLKR